MVTRRRPTPPTSWSRKPRTRHSVFRKSGHSFRFCLFLKLFRGFFSFELLDAVLRRHQRGNVFGLGGVRCQLGEFGALALQGFNFHVEDDGVQLLQISI